MKRLVLVAVVGLVFASLAAAGTTNGTWFGKLRDPDTPEQPLSDLFSGEACRHGDDRCHRVYWDY